MYKATVIILSRCLCKYQYSNSSQLKIAIPHYCISVSPKDQHLPFLFSFNMSGFISKVLLPSLLLSMSVGAIPLAERACSTGEAIYFITNNAENAVVAVSIGDNGTLSGGTVTLTSGKGSNSIDGTTHQPAGPDALVSQGAVDVAEKVTLFETIVYTIFHN